MRLFCMLLTSPPSRFLFRLAHTSIHYCMTLRVHPLPASQPHGQEKHPLEEPSQGEALGERIAILNEIDADGVGEATCEVYSPNGNGTLHGWRFDAFRM